MTTDQQGAPPNPEELGTDQETPVTDWQNMRWRIASAFSPAAPINQADLFAGRTRQMRDIIEVIAQRGQHGIIYGERGVGKTSLTTVVADLLKQNNVIPLRTNCDGSDNFSSIWRKVFAEATFTVTIPGMGFNPTDQEVSQSVAETLPTRRTLSPDNIRAALTGLGPKQLVVVFIDEFDRITDHNVTAMFADTIKLLSDRLVPATVVLVGVADNVDELIREHRSVERAMVQIHMPRMSQPELAEIVDRGLGAVGMKIDPKARLRITQLSQGLPHYTHALALGAAQAAIDRHDLSVTDSDVASAIKTTLSRAQESIKDSYYLATHSPRENLYEQVLLACALAQEDELGFFAAVDVRGPMSKIMRKRYEIAAFGRHLNALSSSERGPALQKKGDPRRFRYRFVNPLLEPYVVMRGLSSGMLDPSQFQ